jgi:hypothetical protein
VDFDDMIVRTFVQKARALVDAQLAQEYPETGRIIQDMTADELTALYASLTGLNAGVLIELIQRRPVLTIPGLG